MPCCAGKWLFAWATASLLAHSLRASSNQAVFSLVQGDDITWHVEKGGPGQGRYPREGEIFQGRDRLSTGRDGKSELCLTNETVIRVGPNSLFFLQPQKRWLSLRQGSLLFQKKPAAKEWTVESGGWVAAVSGSTLFSSHPVEGPAVLGILETASSQGLEVRTSSGGGTWRLPTGRMLWSEEPGNPAEVLPFDPAMVWRHSVLGSNLPGTAWPECTGKIPALSPPRATLEWVYRPEIYEGYPSTMGKRSDMLLRVDRFLLPAAYGTEDQARALVQNQPGFSTLTDPDGHHPLSVALDLNRMDLVKILLPAFKPEAYLNRAGEKFPGSALAKSPLPRAVLMLTPDRFRDFLPLRGWSRREVLDAYAIGANFTLLGSSKPAGGYYLDVARNLVHLAIHQTALSEEENEELLVSCILPAFLALQGTAPLCKDVRLVRNRLDIRIPFQRSNATRSSNPAATRMASSGTNLPNPCTFYLNSNFSLSDNLDQYTYARLTRRESFPRVELQSRQSGGEKDPSIPFREVIDTLCAGSSASYPVLPAVHGLQWAEWWYGPALTPRPLRRPEQAPEFSVSAQNWPKELADQAKALAATTAEGYPDTPFWIAGGRLVLPSGERRLLTEFPPNRTGEFCAAVREPYPAEFYIAGHYPLVLEYNREKREPFAWYGDLHPVPVAAMDRASIRGRISGGRPEAGEATVRLEFAYLQNMRARSSWTNGVAEAEVARDGSFVFQDLAPLPYQLVVRSPGWCVQRIPCYPARGQSLELGSLNLEKAQVLSFRHIVRARRAGAPWLTQETNETISLPCDGESRLEPTRMPSEYAPVLDQYLSLYLSTTEQNAKALPSYGQELREVGTFQISGPSAFEKVPAPTLRKKTASQGVSNPVPSSSTTLKKGRVYLMEGRTNGVEWNWLIEVD